VYTPSFTDRVACAMTTAYDIDSRNPPIDRIATALFISLLFHVSSLFSTHPDG